MKKSLRWKFKLLLHKKYFDTGFSQLHYARYAIMLFGLDAAIKSKMTEVMAGIVLYGLLCYCIGWAWYKYEWVLANYEVDNHFNLLARELRNYMKNKARQARN